MKHSKQQGFTLLELMISLTVGLLLIAGTVTMMSNSSGALKRHEINADMTSAIRLANNLLRHDIQSAGYFGRTRYPADITGRLSGTNPLPNIGGDCYPGFYADIQRYIYASENSNPFSTTCLKDADVAYKENTDVLVVRYAEDSGLLGTAVGDLDPNKIYVYSNPTGGELFRGNNPPSLNPTPYVGTFTGDIQKRFYEVVTYVYFIGNPPNDEPDEDALYRLELGLDSGAPFDPVLISTDIIDLQVRLGIEDCTVGSIGGSSACVGTVDSYHGGNDSLLNLSGSLPAYEAITRIRAVSIGLTAESARIQGADEMGTKNNSMRGKTVKSSIAAMFRSTDFQVRNSENIFSRN